MDFMALAQDCAPAVHWETMARVVSVESSFNPYAIGVVGAHLPKQPRSLKEALETVQWLEARGYNYSLGLAQVNKYNLAKYGLTVSHAFDACRNLGAAEKILAECFSRARKNADEQHALRQAFSCYYAGNFVTGFRDGYVLKILAGARATKSRSVARQVGRPSKIATQEAATLPQTSEVATQSSAMLF